MTEMEQFGAQRFSVKNVENKPDIDFTCSYGFHKNFKLVLCKNTFGKAQWSQIAKFWGGVIVSVPMEKQYEIG